MQKHGEGKDSKRVAAIREEFLGFSKVYDDYVSGQEVNGHHMDYSCLSTLFSMFCENANIEEKENVLDAGTGTGLLAEKIREVAPLSKITGIDISLEMLEKAKEKGCLDTAICADLEERLPFENGSFDKVFSNSVFEFIENKEHVLNELSRVTAPGGVMAIAAIDSEVISKFSSPDLEKIAEKEAPGYTVTNEDKEVTMYRYCLFKKRMP